MNNFEIYFQGITCKGRYKVNFIFMSLLFKKKYDFSLSCLKRTTKVGKKKENTNVEQFFFFFRMCSDKFFFHF